MTETASFVDYFDLQGGRPEIWQDEGGVWHIKHSYRPDCPEVVTHIPPQERGQVILNGKVFEVASLWEFEGEPCERQSNLVGGDGYKRNRQGF